MRLRWGAVLILAVSSGTPGCEPHGGAGPRPSDPAAGLVGTDAPESLVDPERAARADVVVRVERLSSGSGSKYVTPRVRVLKVLKNAVGADIPSELEVAHYSWLAPLPAGVSTIYLEPYGEGSDLLKLLDFSTVVGVSHAASTRAEGAAR